MSSSARKLGGRPANDGSVEAAEPGPAVETSEPSPLLTGPARLGGGAAAGVAGIVTGEVVGADDAGRPRVAWKDGPSEGVPAGTVWMESAPRWQDCRGLRVAIGFDDGDPARPVVLGLLEPPPRRADGKPRTLRFESGEELILECGESKIVLRADGSITILGVKVVSRARKVNKIRGGSVQIN